MTDGECPGHVSPGGLCGCYDDDEIAEWIAEREHADEIERRRDEERADYDV